MIGDPEIVLLGSALASTFKIDGANKSSVGRFSENHRFEMKQRKFDATGS